MLSVNWKHVQLVKIYMPCNFEVNLITCLGVIPLYSSFFSSPDPKDGLPSRISSIKLPLPWENLLCHLNTYKRLTLECVTDCLMNLCVSVGVFPMSTQNFIAALCSTLFENVVFSDEEGFIFKIWKLDSAAIWEYFRFKF